MNTKKTFIMSEKSCPKYVPGLTIMPKKKKNVNPPVTIVLLLHGIGQTLSSILNPNGA